MRMISFLHLMCAKPHACVITHATSLIPAKKNVNMTRSVTVKFLCLEHYSQLKIN